MTDAGSSIAALGAEAPTPIDGQLGTLRALLSIEPVDESAAAAALAAIRDAVSDLVEESDQVTEALVRSYDRISAFRALSIAGLSSLGRDEAQLTLLDLARRLTGSDLAVLIDRDDVVGSGGTDRELNQLATAARAASPEFLRPVHLPGEHQVTVVARVGAPDDGFRALALRRRAGGSYSLGDLQLVESVVAVAEMSRQLSVLHANEVLRATVEREHQLASTLAQAALDMPAPQLDGVDYFSTTIPASLAGGDFHTCSVVDGAIWFAVGDVAGKGLPAALVMTRAVSAARVAFRSHATDDVAGAMRSMSDEIYGYLEDVGLFVTVAIGCFRPSTGLLTLSNAGHSPIVLVRDGSRELIRPTGPPIGVVASPTARALSMKLAVGDSLVLGSDGLVEQENPSGAMVGYDTFLGLCSQGAGESVNDWAARILASVASHADGAQPSDDRTLVIVASDGAVLASDSDDLVMDANALALREIGPWLTVCLSRLDDAEAAAIHSRLELAVHEVCTNVLDHAGQAAMEPIRVRLAITPSAVTVHVRDRGAAFDPTTVSAPQSGEVHEHGYGLTIIRKLTDSVEFMRDEGENVCTLIVVRDPSHATSSEVSP